MRGWKSLMEAYGADISTKELQRFFLKNLKDYADFGQI